MLVLLQKIFSNRSLGFAANLHSFGVPPSKSQPLNFNITHKRYQSRQSTFQQPQDLRALQLKNKPSQPKVLKDKFKTPGVFTIAAYPTAEEIDLEKLLPVIREKLPYKAEHLLESLDVIRATNTERLGCEPQEIYVFREGAVVLWNVSRASIPEVLKQIRSFEQHRYADHVVEKNAELMAYAYNYRLEEYVGVTTKQEVMLSPSDSRWEKYITSQVLAATVKLAVWEQQLGKYINNIEFVTEDLKYGRRIKISQEMVLRKHGALFALRHVINLSSSLLEPPQMMNYTMKLDNMYRDLMNFYAVNKRLKVLQEKLNHCLELINLLSSHLRDKHRLRLEWLVITLIIVELGFEAFYCIDRIMS